MSYIMFCTLELLFPKDFIHIKHILYVERGKGPQYSIRTEKKYQIFFGLFEGRGLFVRNLLMGGGVIESSQYPHVSEL